MEKKVNFPKKIYKELPQSHIKGNNQLIPDTAEGKEQYVQIHELFNISLVSNIASFRKHYQVVTII